MNLAQEMRKIATEYHEVIDGDFLTSVGESIKSSASSGKFELDVDVTNVNMSTLNKLMSTLREHGFKVELDVLQSCATISW